MPNLRAYFYFIGFYFPHMSSLIFNEHFGIMVDLCPVVKMVWYSNGGLKTGQKKPVYGPNCPAFEWSTKSHDFTILIPDTHTVQYSGAWCSDGYCSLVFLSSTCSATNQQSSSQTRKSIQVNPFASKIKEPLLIHSPPKYTNFFTCPTYL